MRARRPAAIFAVAAVISAGLIAVVALINPRGAFGPGPAPHPPLGVEILIMPRASSATVAPRGGRIEDDGSLTIVSAPGSPGRAQPWLTPPSQWGVRGQPFDPAPKTMLGGLRAFFRAAPPPPRKADQTMVMTLERRIGHGRLMLVRGCFRLDSATGPLAVFPPGARLGRKDGYLIVGPPGFPPALSARIGEHIFREGAAVASFDQASRRRMAERCGNGPAQTVVPASATVQQATNDGFAASSFADRYGLPWEAALIAVRRCRDRLDHSTARTPDDGPMVDNPCGTTPPPPVADQADCPSGTSLAAGLCRTPRGHIRPVPAL